MASQDICDKEKIVRDRALELLSAELSNFPSKASEYLVQIESLITENNFWEAQLGCLKAVALILPHISELEPGHTHLWKTVIVANLDSEESRVRSSAAIAAGVLVAVNDSEYDYFRTLSLTKLKVNF